MAKPPARSYAALSLEELPAQAALPVPAQDAPGRPEKGKPYVTYLHPRGHRALRLYALESGGSVQGIIIEALEAWTKAHGITEPVRPERTK
jgi:hypothetical protein